MRAPELTELLRRRPFVPLRIHLTGGQIYDIRHPDMVILMRQRVDFGVQPDPATGVVERVERVSLVHVVRIEELPSAAPTNGAPAEPG
jgi:hypothetical protein